MVAAAQPAGEAVRHRRVVAAIDSSAAARAVLSSAAEMGRILHAEVHAVHVDEGHAEGSLAAAGQAALPLHIARGPAARIVTELSREPDVAALVMGARAVPAGARPLGSTAREVVVTLAKPVLLVPPQCALPVRLTRWLVPTEASPVTLEALRDLIGCACEAKVHVTALHVHEMASVPAFDDQPHHEIRAWQQEFLRRYCSHPDAVDLLVRVGHPGEQVLEVAQQIETEMIVLAWSRKLSPGRAPLVQTVLEHSRVPVLLSPSR